MSQKTTEKVPARRAPTRGSAPASTAGSAPAHGKTPTPAPAVGPNPTDGTPAAATPQPAVERRAVVDRRSGGDRRSQLDRRRGPGRRRTDYRRAAEEGHMNEEQLDFLKAVDEYKRVNDRPFPTLTEILDIALYLGYRRVAPVGEFKLVKGRQHPPRGGAANRVDTPPEADDMPAEPDHAPAEPDDRPE